MPPRKALDRQHATEPEELITSATQETRNLKAPTPIF